MIRVAFILFIFIMSISSCQKERPNILAPENVITSPETNYVYITNFVTNNGIITITLDYINSQISALSFEVPNTPDDVKEVFTDFIYKSIPKLPEGSKYPQLTMQLKSKWILEPYTPISIKAFTNVFQKKIYTLATNIGCNVKGDIKASLSRSDDGIENAWLDIEFSLSLKTNFQIVPKELAEAMTNNPIKITFKRKTKSSIIWENDTTTP
ncbi:hypothetical protein [uncultured Brachyspira sp.]|uniref:hypothetical protein n=1 Tax=uncultured Brachyspira sp. TaxID=221953 RepID=UPI0025FEC1AC|nr:hypothetical protein [uncultured Brachyspira sp.]